MLLVLAIIGNYKVMILNDYHDNHELMSIIITVYTLTSAGLSFCGFRRLAVICESFISQN